MESRSHDREAAQKSKGVRAVGGRGYPWQFPKEQLVSLRRAGGSMHSVCSLARMRSLLSRRSLRLQPACRGSASGCPFGRSSSWGWLKIPVCYPAGQWEGLTGPSVPPTTSSLRVLKASRGRWLLLRIYKSGVLTARGLSIRPVGALGRRPTGAAWRPAQVLPLRKPWQSIALFAAEGPLMGNH